MLSFLYSHQKHQKLASLLPSLALVQTTLKSPHNRMIHSTILHFLGYKKSSVESFKCRICKYTLQNLSYFSWKWKMLEVKFQDQSWGFS
ncbi:hypothetical protein V6Z12_A08G142600 [Gossypium hirsutum]